MIYNSEMWVSEFSLRANDECRCVVSHEHVLSRPTCGSTFLAVVEGARAHRSQTEALGSLLSCCITSLVGMPQLLTMVTELCAAALPPTRQFWTTGTPKGNNCISAKGGQRAH